MKGKAPLFATVTFLVTFVHVRSAVLPTENPAPPSGMVWARHGDWKLNGGADSLRLGEAIPSGGLLTASPDASPHSITVLLPDGQRMLCECYEQATCSQGFRVPAITPLPSPGVWSMFVDVQNALLLRPPSAETAFPIPAGRAVLAANVEMVAGLDAQGEVSIATALRVLPSGQYSLSVADDAAHGNATPPSMQPLTWVAGQPGAKVRVGSPGIYRIRVLDLAGVPRIEVEALAASPASTASEADNLKHAREAILRWQKTHEGWSLHPFLRAYLQARAIAVSQ